MTREGEAIEARWKGYGNERGHWRIICGACSAVLGYVDLRPWSWHVTDFPTSECPREKEAYPLPPHEQLVGVACDGNYEYRPDRNGYFHVRRPARFGKYGQPVPSRGGRHHRPGTTDPYFERLARACGRYVDGVASELEQEMVEHSVVGEVPLTDRDRLVLRQLMREPGGMFRIDSVIDGLPSHTDIVLGNTNTFLPFLVYCPREKADPSHPLCGELNFVHLPAFATLARLNHGGEWLAVLRDNDPILNGAGFAHNG